MKGQNKASKKAGEARKLAKDMKTRKEDVSKSAESLSQSSAIRYLNR